MKKILYSASAIVAVAAMVLYSTGAFFSDTETSTGNVFTAGAIDLKVDSQQHYNNAVCVGGVWQLEPNATATVPQYPVIGSACGGTWGQNVPGVDITSEKFFNFGDIKPGDSGENTISLHVVNNDAWICASVANLTNLENGETEPEALVDLSTDVNAGELQQNMVWKVWRDDGDNIWENGEVVLAEGQPVNGELAVYDSTTQTGPLLGATTGYLGVSWSLPLATGNEVQTDSMTGDISFTVVQARNNSGYVCGRQQEPVIVWVETTQTQGDASIVPEDDRGNVLRLVTIADNSSRVRWTNSTLNLNLSTFTGVSYDSKQVSANDPINGNATMRLTIDLDGDLITTPGDIVEITYEPYYNFNSQNPSNIQTSIITGTWQTWNTTPANGKFWANGNFLGSTPNGGAYATNFTLAQVLAAHANAKIVGISLGMGTWNQNQVVLVDDLMINGSPVSLEN